MPMIRVGVEYPKWVETINDCSGYQAVIRKIDYFSSNRYDVKSMFVFMMLACRELSHLVVCVCKK